MDTLIQASEPWSEKREKCENVNTLMIAKSEKRLQAIIFHPRCKQWSCPACSEINKSKWAIFAKKTNIYITDRLYFVTVTARPKHKNLATSMISFTDAWKRLLARVNYYNSMIEWFGLHSNPKKFIYLAIPEQTKRGIMHMHLVCNQWYFMRLSKIVSKRRKKSLVQLRWKDIAMESGLGYEADVKQVKSGEVSDYVTKYLSKDMGNVEWPKGFRRVRLSRTWPRIENDPIGDWTFQQLDPKAIEWNNQIEIKLITDGYTIHYADHLESWNIIDRYEDLFSELD